MTDGKRPYGIVTDTEIRINLKLTKERDGVLFCHLHERVAHLSPKRRAAFIRAQMLEWMVAAQHPRQLGAKDAAAAAGSRQPQRQLPSDSASRNPGYAQREGSQPHADAAKPLDLSQLDNVEMTFDFT